MLGIIGEKLGMTQIYRKDGSAVPVTVVKILPNAVVGTRTREAHGYNAIQLAYGEQKMDRLNNSERGFYKKIKQTPCRHIKEFRTERAAEYKVGMKLTVAALSEGQKVNIQGSSKGKGFQGVIKNFHFSGGPATHGVSLAHRVPGSIGQRTDPGRVIKGKRLPRHMGDETVTVKNLEIMGVESEQNLVLVKGAVPGARTSRLYVYPNFVEFEARVLDANKAVEQNESTPEIKANKPAEETGVKEAATEGAAQV
ncbi:MAG: 50S ribosomal protein L3 [Deltaproteobacteria bacterium]|nr:50S ribosomal protein L3 [Deltaproteobacteria bacterium]